MADMAPLCPFGGARGIGFGIAFGIALAPPFDFQPNRDHMPSPLRLALAYGGAGT
jgi:hypothetical protein